jgi:hypothetical protein
MRADSWGGLVTNASPFVVPIGAAVEQVNVGVNVPGVLRVRGGMRPVSVSPPVSSLADIVSVDVAGLPILLCMSDSGAITAHGAPDRGTELPAPSEPTLSAPLGQVATSYTMRYRDGRSGASSD